MNNSVKRDQTRPINYNVLIRKLISKQFGNRINIKDFKKGKNMSCESIIKAIDKE